MFWCPKGQLFSRTEGCITDRKQAHGCTVSVAVSVLMHRVSGFPCARGKRGKYEQHKLILMELCICWGRSHHEQKSHIKRSTWKAKEQNSRMNVLETNWKKPNPISQSEKRLLICFLHCNLCSPVHLWENGDASLPIWWCGQDIWVAKKETDLHILLIFLLLPLP